MKLEVGMYVRTKNRGIAKFRGWSAYDENKVAIHTHNEGNIEITPVIDKTTIVKASNNIIDLIEVGDIVTYEFPTGLGMLKYENVTVLEDLLNTLKSSDEYKILSIVTLQQFESMQYKVD